MAKESRFVHAIRKNHDGTVTKKKFTRDAWTRLTPQAVNPFGDKTGKPKQGWEEVPEGWNETPPASLEAEAAKMKVQEATALAEKEAAEATELAEKEAAEANAQGPKEVIADKVPDGTQNEE